MLVKHCRTELSSLRSVGMTPTWFLDKNKSKVCISRSFVAIFEINLEDSLHLL